MPEHPSDEYRQLHEWADGYGWMLTPAADRLADRIIDGMDPHPTPGVMAALASCYPDRLIMADTRAVRRPARTGMGDMLTVVQWMSIARHGDPAACRILDGMRRGMDDALACGRLRGMCTPA